MNLRLATAADFPAMRVVMAAAIGRLQNDYLTAEQVAASHAVMGLDTQLVDDGTYFVALEGDRIVGCGGWSRRATLYGGDHSSDLREPRLLDPATEPARIRAMYTHPDAARRGVGRLILAAVEQAAHAEGFTAAQLMATLSGEPLYRASGYTDVERIMARSDGVDVPLILMTKRI
ncbi:GNAT family N-acetyltransferase [Sphingomonas sp. LY160]|uniref:GNAT family N-acetyltransferase n=1 Tax=Sphingomonas sp. LY160 TaxID=3095342 RepID=UPI002ADEE936|nr:GNAT family N-acetyltransferase [Sphingomonas sp. LY160]MEA1072618.1 GNAT family N-acetyltransferase [Sphingomonas sp. LY160]